jgi:hypothetical protein
VSREEEIGKLTLATLQLSSANDPLIKSIYKKLLVHDYNSFVDYVEDELATCIQQLESNPEHHCNKGEDEVTISLRDMLVMKGVDAEHDVQHGGHVDLFIKQASWKYHAEAKIYKGNVNSYEGWLQLTTRYASGTPCNKGCILLYLQEHAGTLNVMKGWKVHIEDKVDDISVNFCGKNPLALVSTHALLRTGLPYHIRHLPVSLYFKPLDKSGRNSKKYN